MAPLSFKFLLERADNPPSQATVSVQNLPASILEQLGALASPPGIKPNFVNPESIGGILLGFSIVGIIIMSICIAIRGWVTLKLINPIRWAWSDVFFIWAILAALTLFMDTIALVTGGGQTGIHQWNVPLSKIVLDSNFFKSSSVVTLMTPICLGLIKTTIFLTYIEIFSRIRWLRLSCYIGIGITAVFYSIVLGLTIWWSFPHRGETFVQHYLIANNGIKSLSLSIPTASVGLAIDMYLFLVPSVAVSGLKMQRRKKIAVVLIFATGFLAIIASILSIIYRVILNRSPDHTWNVVSVFSLFTAELWIGMIIACTPHFSQFFRAYQKGFGAVGSAITTFFCCCCIFWKERDSRTSSKTSMDKYGKNGGKSSDKSEESQVSEPKQPKKAKKMYPDLDVTTVGGSVIGNQD